MIYSVHILAIPKHVMIIRHGELTPQSEAVVDFTGWHLKPMKLTNSQPLNVRGWQRAYALAPFFTMQPEILKFGKIVALYAPYPNADYNSVRPIQTVTPLSEKMKKKINIKYNIDQGALLVDEIMNNKKYDNKTVLVAYEHMHIPRLAQLFDMFASYGSALKDQSSGITVVQLSNQKKSLVPAQWGQFQDGTSIFDQVWVLTFDTKTGKIIHFDNVAQKLLYQDSANPFLQQPTEQKSVPVIRDNKKSVDQNFANPILP